MNLVRAVIESTYDDICNVYEFITVTDKKTNITKQKETLALKDQPCKVSFQSSPTVSTDDAAKQSQTIKLFISPNVVINPGSKLSITHCGCTENYSRSGIPAIHDTHQEIILEEFRGYA